MSSFGLPALYAFPVDDDRVAGMKLVPRQVDRWLGVEAEALHVPGHRSPSQRLGDLRPDRVHRVGERRRQVDRTERLVVVIGQRDAGDRHRRLAVDDRVGRVLAGVDRGRRGDDLERRTRRIAPLDRAVDLALIAAWRQGMQRVVGRIGVHRQHGAVLRIERHHRADPAGQLLLGDRLGLGVERRVHVVADLMAAERAEDRAQPRLDALQLGAVRPFQPGGLALSDVGVPGRLGEQRAVRVGPAPGAAATLHRARQHGTVGREDPASLDPQLGDQRPAVERIVVQSRRVDHGPARRPDDQQREQDDDQPEQADDLRVHGATGRRERSETSSSSARSTKLATIDAPP